VLVVLFNCNHCPTAQAYEERVKSIVNDYRDKGVALVAISPNDPKSVRLDELGYTDLSDTFDEMKVRAKHRQYNFPYLYDGDTEETSKKYGPVATPHAFVFDKERKLRYAGRIDDSERPQLAKTHELRDAIDAVVAGKEPAVATTKTFGCSIKWAGKEDSVKQYMDKLAAEPVDVKPVDEAGLRDLRKNAGEKVRLVNFWATWCGPCVQEMPELSALANEEAGQRFNVIGLGIDSPSAMSEFAAKHNIKYPLYVGGMGGTELSRAFGNTNGGLPFTVLIGADGQVRKTYLGKLKFDELKAVLAAL
jgi:peroxiredoxin